MPECIISYWPAWFRARYGGELPKTYCVIDVETSGFSPDRDVVTEYAHLLVHDGKITSHSSIIFDWTNHKIVPMHWLERQLQNLHAGMALKGRRCQITIKRMQEEGMKAEEALKFANEHLSVLKANGVPFVLHGGIFDERMLSANFLGFGIAKGFTFGPEGYFDTDCIEKASQLISNERMQPKRNDTLRSYFHRVRYTRATGVKSNLDRWCYEKYNLRAHGIERRDMHEALVDVKATHLVFEAQRAQVTSPKEDFFPSVDHREARKVSPQALAPMLRRRVRGMRNN